MSPVNKQLKYYTAAQTRELDRLAIEDYKIPGYTLMQRAGKAAFDALIAKWPECRKLVVFCGTGNNGGDGFVIAALARTAGLDARVYLNGQAGAIKGDALKAYQAACDKQVPILTLQALPQLQQESENTVTVDALLGTGLSGAVREDYARVIKLINESGLPVLAVDIPSGLCSDTGRVLGAAVKANLTVTFIGRKIGLAKGNGPELCGQLVFDDLGVPPEIYQQLDAG